MLWSLVWNIGKQLHHFTLKRVDFWGLGLKLCTEMLIYFCLACVARVSIGFSAGLKHFGHVKIGASAKSLHSHLLRRLTFVWNGLIPLSQFLINHSCKQIISLWNHHRSSVVSFKRCMWSISEPHSSPACLTGILGGGWEGTKLMGGRKRTGFLFVPSTCSAAKECTQMSPVSN